MTQKYMTQSEAVQLWCPMTHTRLMLIFHPDSQTPQQTEQAEFVLRKSRCLAGKCAAWQWQDFNQEQGCCGLVSKTEGRS